MQVNKEIYLKAIKLWIHSNRDMNKSFMHKLQYDNAKLWLKYCFMNYRG